MSFLACCLAKIEIFSVGAGKTFLYGEKVNFKSMHARKLIQYSGQVSSSSSKIELSFKLMKTDFPGVFRRNFPNYNKNKVLFFMTGKITLIAINCLETD